MGTFPGDFGVLRSDRRGGAAPANRAALVVLAVRADGHKRIGGQRARRFRRAQGPGSREDRSPLRSTAPRCPHRNGPRTTAIAAWSADDHADVSPQCACPPSRHAERWRARARDRCMAGDWRNAECPHAPDNSSSIQDDPADAVPYIGSLRASDWSLHGCSLRSGHPSTGTTTASRSSLRISTVASARSRPGKRTRVGDRARDAAPGRRRHTTRETSSTRSGSRSTTRPPELSTVATSPWRH